MVRDRLWLAGGYAACALLLSCGSEPGSEASEASEASEEPSEATSEAGQALQSAVCTPPIQAVNTSTPTTVVGNGSAASCTEAAFAAAVQKGGIIKFNCGGPATIKLTSQKSLPTSVNTTIDGGNQITLDGGGTTRLLYFFSPNFRATHTTVTLQNITLANGKATGTAIPTAPAPCSQGFDIDAGGGAIWMRDGILHVINTTFNNNQGASLGPDVGGGAVYAVGSLDVTIVGSSFNGNSASNGGAVGSLFSNLTLTNDTFSSNLAVGTGGNTIDTSKCSVNGGEVGNGGNGGAVVIDGGEDFNVQICGSAFQGNQGNALGGAIFRTPDLNRAPTTIDRTTFSGNKSANGGGAMYFHHTDLAITASTLSNNTAGSSGGALQADDTTLNFTNVTITGNTATKGLGGAIALFGNGGKLLNCTFAGNTAPGGSGLFGAAIAGGTALTINNTIFDTNTTEDCGAPMACADNNASCLGGSNLQWPQTHKVCGGADPACAPGTTFASANLNLLGNYGGPTATMPPKAGSPALGKGAACPSTDQRGNPRPATGCTLGAVEGGTSASSTNVCATGNENSAVTLSCPAGNVIKSVVFASYGTPTGTCGGFATSTCNASTSAAVVSNACLGKQSCTVNANNATFGDPCSGTFKRLDAEVTCAP